MRGTSKSPGKLRGAVLGCNGGVHRVLRAFSTDAVVGGGQGHTWEGLKWWAAEVR